VNLRFKNWGGRDPHRTAEDVAYSVARFFQTGGTFQNYYMVSNNNNSQLKTLFMHGITDLS